MSSKKGGVQAKMMKHYLYATYIHCMAHKLNLIVVDMCKHVNGKSIFKVFKAFLVVSSYLINYIILIICLELSDRQFIKKFRLTKTLVQELINILAPYMTEPTRSSSITIKTKVKL